MGRRTIVTLRGRPAGTEHVIIDVLLTSRHELGWKGWIIEDRRSPKTVGLPLLWLSQDWVEFAYIDMRVE